MEVLFVNNGYNEDGIWISMDEYMEYRQLLRQREKARLILEEIVL